MCLSKKIIPELCCFFALLKTASPLKTFFENVCRCIALNKNEKQKKTKCSLKTTVVLLDINEYELT